MTKLTASMFVLMGLMCCMFVLSQDPCPDGCVGEKGKRGRRGKRGQQGDQGLDGTDGDDGRNGDDGGKGDVGPAGPNGKDGTNGVDGGKGPAGTNGVDGGKGPAGPKGSDAHCSATYIRWGRTTCPTSATLVYEGVVGGSHYTHSGSGAEKVCLPLTPQWGDVVSGFEGSARMYGAEYETGSSDVRFPGEDPDGELRDEDVPCCLCVIPRCTSVMIPAWNTCPTGWVTEYTGYLMSAYHGQAKSSYDCIDAHPEKRLAGGANHNGALFYMVEAVCGSLPCPPYVDGNELTCAVCSK